ncbi:MAG: outer membrane beta-barrel protein [Myxococcota bacterium]
MHSKLSSLFLLAAVGAAPAVAIAQDEEAAPAAEEGAPAEAAGEPASEGEAMAEPTTKMTLGADGAIAVPFGNLGDGAGIGIGALVRFEYDVNADMAATGRLGYIHHLAKNDVTFSEIPIMAGLKYALSGPLYGAGEVGIVHTKAEACVTILGTETCGTGSDDNLALGVGAGYEMGELDLRAQLNILDLGHAGDSTEIGLNVGYNFTHF